MSVNPTNDDLASGSQPESTELKEIAILRLLFQMNARLRLEVLAALSRTFRAHGVSVSDNLLSALTFAISEELPGESTQPRIELKQPVLGLQAQPPTDQPPTGQPPTGQPPTGQPPTGQPPTGQPPTGQPPTGQPPTGQPPTGQPPTGQPPTGQPPTGQPPTGQPSPRPPGTPPPKRKP